MHKNQIRNFCIIAHIDHGKSTLVDRFLEITKTIPPQKIKPQFLDRLETEREHGITIKMQPVQMIWQGHILNLIDTPGHIDFSYEVSRALKSVEGAILLVDAASGVEAQTLTVLDMAKSLGLKIIPVVNKIDLAQAETEKVANELRDLFVNKTKISLISAKTGEGVKELLSRLIKELPAPHKRETSVLKALVFDANFDSHCGIIAHVRIFEGNLRKNEDIYLAGTGISAKALEIGVFKPDFQTRDQLDAGDIGYVITDLKNINEVLIGDTFTQSPPLPPNFEVVKGFEKPQARIFASLYPQDEIEYSKLKKSLGILSLNDSAFQFFAEFSSLFGRGFRIGALGNLHLKIIQERLEKEFGISTIVTSPCVAYKFVLSTQRQILTDRIDTINFAHVKKILEPKAKVKVIFPIKFQGRIINLLNKKHARFLNTQYLSASQRVILEYELPFAVIAKGLYEEIMSISSGFASMSYELSGYKEEGLVKIDIAIAGKIFSPLSFLTDKKSAYAEAKKRVVKIKKILPRQLFELDIKAQIGTRVIAKERIPALRKDVLAKLYGGDRTRKDKLLQKQKAGKKRMKQLGNLSLPADLFFKIGQEL